MTDIQAWNEELLRTIRERGVKAVAQAEALERTASTQAAAHDLARRVGPCVVCTDQQSNGRGRLGRAWVERPQLGLAATFALRASEYDPAELPIRAGVAACLACESLAPASKLGLRWPNDVVVREDPRRKLAGVLIEVDGPWALVGVGVNVRHEPRDLPTELAGRATSLAMLGGDRSPMRLSIELLAQMDRMMAASIDDVVADWRSRDVLIGTRQEFHVGHAVLHGEVESIEPASEIVLRLDSGERRRLDPRQASLVHDRPDWRIAPEPPAGRRSGGSSRRGR